MGKNNLIANLVFVLGPILFGVLVIFATNFILVAPRFALVTVVVTFTLGVICLFAAKFPSIRKGVFVSFGPGKLAKPYRSLYYVSYILLSLGIVFTFALLIAYKLGVYQ